jgi:hypothetical protein
VHSTGPLDGRHHGDYNMLMDTTKKFIYYEEDDCFIGWLEEYPDYRTQGQTLEDLREHLCEVYKDLTCGEIPCVRKAGELSIS